MANLRLTCATVAATAVTLIVGSQWSIPQATAAAPKIVDNFQLIDQHGFAHELYRLRDAKAIVLAMHVVGNEQARHTSTVLTALKKSFPSVEFRMINSSLDDLRAAIEAEAKTAGIALPILDDDNQLIGESLGAGYAG